MSVLLDALKKAAEEKKNAASNDSPDVETVKPESSVSESLTLSSDLDSREEAVKGDELTIEAENTSVYEKPETTDFSMELKLEDENLSEDFTHNDASTESLKVNPEAFSSEPIKLEIEKEPTFKLETIEEDISLSKDFSPVETENQVEETGLEELSIKLEEKNIQIESDATQDLTSLIDSLDIGDTSPVENVKLIEGGKREELGNALNADPITKMEVSSLPDASHTSLGSKEKQELSDFQQVTNEAPAPQKTNESFEWTMDELPGYSPSASEKPSSKQQSKASLEKNPILIHGENKPPKPSKKKYTTSSKIFLSLFVVLLFLVIGFYGILYYQEQNSQLEQSMRKYNIASTQIRQPITPVQTNSIESDVTNKEVIKIVPANSDLKESSSVDLAQISNTENIVQEKTTLVKQPVVDLPKKKKNTSKQNIESGKAKTVYKPRDTGVSNQERVYKNSNRAKSQPVVKINQVKSNLAEAYTAYGSGNYQLASKYFDKVLNSQPKNIRALLGLGGVAVAKGNFVSAVGYYQKVLDIKPNHLSAFEAIANLSGAVPLNNEWENELFEMVRKYPDSATLQYASGNIHAKKGDWLAAQENYFNSVVLDRSNADFMLNLAVSYDHLGEYDLASQYYTQALASSNVKPVSFDEEQVRKRLISIRQLKVKGY